MLEDKDLKRLLTDVSTVVWRIRKRLKDGGHDDAEQVRRITRDINSLSDSLSNAALECHDQTGKNYVSGMALHVIFQPTEGIDQETIIQTTKPTVYFRERLIQRGEVIVATSATTNDKTPETERKPNVPDGPDATSREQTNEIDATTEREPANPQENPQ